MIPPSEFRNPKYEEIIRFAREALGLSRSVPIDFSPLKGRGSDRTFFRLKWNPERSAILIHYDPKRLENTYYANIAIFLQDIDIPVPRLIRHDPVKLLIVMEDLGDTDLWSLRKTPWDIRKLLYQKTLINVYRLHSFPVKDFPSERVRLMENFSPELYHWERNYFKDHFIRDVCKMELESSFERELEAELFSLARRLAATKYCLVHRDLQSQNVMIRNGEPFLIDFQGMRFGSPFYDLGSLLCDPYISLSQSDRDELLSFYYGISKWDLDWVAFRNTFWEASAQRLMQVLGAFGFLGLTKGLQPYLEHIPAGLHHLQLAAENVPTLPRLRELSQACHKAIERKGDRE
jgi:aminoglycoside/choline kinase family phosphotransferase